MILFLLWLASFTELQWVLSFTQHQEASLCQTLAGAKCEAAAEFLARFKGSFHFTSSGRCCEVSCFSWSVRNGLCLHLPASVACLYLEPGEIPPVRAVYWEEIWMGWQERKAETRGWIFPWKTILPLHLLKRDPQTQLVNVMQLTRLWYGLINYSQLALKGGRKRWTHGNKHQQKNRKPCVIEY